MSDRRVDVCANCGIKSGDAVKLKDCTACRLVKYCGVDCQRAHRKRHKGACKQRAAELKDEQLYRVCHGCVAAAGKRGMRDCPFCRASASGDDAEILAKLQKRVDAKDPTALEALGEQYFYGMCGLEKDVPHAIELWSEAAGLGSLEAHNRLAEFYLGDEIGVTVDGVARNFSKADRHWEEAAMQGHVLARHNLGNHEHHNGNYERAVRHWLISAKMGEKWSLDAIKDMFVDGIATKQQYASALKGYQAAMRG
ncbi:hypothetical protein THAOC_07236 [Thalassiosira oceanica]|uniref:MYND-type domain-containing protein n=1 Tax=Thalassiosira oceanica TaxID=159749 RepID=K0TCY5_THAOC|nr:hypothetical protein THAOC_07236 [Thalassiosira oceanica]|eukprot:EJK71341.1 hypothetical protein THAOC_07236 [Thalassiosira oceanica]